VHGNPAREGLYSGWSWERISVLRGRGGGNSKKGDKLGNHRKNREFAKKRMGKNT